MSKLFYKFATTVSRHVGDWFFVVSAWWVAAGFFFLFPRRVAASVRFYRALYPEKSAFYARLCSWRQYQRFTRVFLDRWLLQEGVDLQYDSEGWEYLEEAINRKTGGILLMSHLGNWEVAAHLLKKSVPDMPLLLYMGIRNKEQIESLQKKSISAGDVRVIAVSKDQASPFDLIEGLSFLRSGGLVSITGDRLWHREQRAIKACFLGRDILFPETPHLLALLSGAPVFTLFTFRLGPRRYLFTVAPPRFVKASSRSERRETISRSVQQYADALEQAVRQHPLDWGHFGDFPI